MVLSFAIDKKAAHRVGEDYKPDTSFGRLGSWSPRAFRRLTTVGNLAGILLEGVRGQFQDLTWITDFDEIAPNETKHREATALLGHRLSVYLTGQMGNLRFGTSASDPGDFSIEDTIAIADIAAGSLGEVLSHLAPHRKGNSVERLFVPGGAVQAPRVRQLVEWHSATNTRLEKVNVVLDEHQDGCSVRTLSLFTDLRRL